MTRYCQFGISKGSNMICNNFVFGGEHLSEIQAGCAYSLGAWWIVFTKKTLNYKEVL